MSIGFELINALFMRGSQLGKHILILELPVIQVGSCHLRNLDWFNKPFTVSLWDSVNLRHIWINLWDKHTTYWQYQQDLSHRIRLAWWYMKTTGHFPTSFCCTRQDYPKKLYQLTMCLPWSRQEKVGRSRLPSNHHTIITQLPIHTVTLACSHPQKTTASLPCICCESLLLWNTKNSLLKQLMQNAGLQFANQTSPKKHLMAKEVWFVRKMQRI